MDNIIYVYAVGYSMEWNNGIRNLVMKLDFQIANAITQCVIYKYKNNTKHEHCTYFLGYTNMHHKLCNGHDDIIPLKTIHDLMAYVEESIGHRWIPLVKDQRNEIWCIIWC